MAKQIFINLAVKDLQKSADFYTALGFSANPQFSDDTAKCMVWSDSIFVMLLTHEKFSSFTSKPIADTKSAVAGLFSLLVDSVEEVNSITKIESLQTIHFAVSSENWGLFVKPSAV